MDEVEKKKRRWYGRRNKRKKFPVVIKKNKIIFAKSMKEYRLFLIQYLPESNVILVSVDCLIDVVGKAVLSVDLSSTLISPNGVIQSGLIRATSSIAILYQ